MKKIFCDKTFFNIKDTLSCGQIFRFREEGEGYFCCSADKCVFLSEENGKTVITCEDADENYFKEYFDLNRDYKAIYERAAAAEEEIVRKSALAGKGVRILKQDKAETLFSFIISQNNNIQNECGK